MLEHITFLLAFIGFVGLTVTAGITAHSRLPARLWRVTAAVILVHVVLVWMVRYEWRLAEATRNGPGGFLLFHGALAMIVASLLVAERHARILVWMAFAIVSAGAIGAVFRYDVVALYRAPVLVTASAGAVMLARACLRARRHRVSAA